MSDAELLEAIRKWVIENIVPTNHTADEITVGEMMDSLGDEA